MLNTLHHAWTVRVSSLVILVALALTSCAGSQGRPAPTSTPKITVWTTAIPTPLPPPTLSIKQAWVTPVIKTFSGKQTGIYEFLVVDSATPDGRYLVGTLKPRDFSKTAQLPSFLALYDLITNQVIKLHQLNKTTSQISGAGADDHWIVWTEVSNLDLSDWSFSAYNRQTGQIVHIEQQPRDSNGTLIPYPVPTFGIDQGVLVWDDGSGGSFTQGSDSNAVIKMRDMATGTVKTLGTKAFHPVISWPWVSWNELTSATTGDVLVTNLTTGQQVHLAVEPNALALSKNALAYIESGMHSIYEVGDITATNTTATKLATVANGEFMELPTINTRLIGWTGGSQSLVWDRLFQCFVTIPTTNRKFQVYIRVEGPLLIWADNPPQSEIDASNAAGLDEAPLTYYVIDTRTLPTTAP